MPDSRAKPISLVHGHRTKAELAARAEGEKSLKTEQKAKMSAEVRADPVARKHWNRVIKAFREVGLDEAFYEGGINRYCVMQSEHERAVGERDQLVKQLEKLQANSGIMETGEYFKLYTQVQTLIDRKDQTIAKLRDQLLFLERENLMTVQGKLRAVPKTPKVESSTGIEAFMKRKMG